MGHKRRIMLLEQAFDPSHQSRFFRTIEPMWRGMLWNGDLHIVVQYLVFGLRSGPLRLGLNPCWVVIMQSVPDNSPMNLLFLTQPLDVKADSNLALLTTAAIAVGVDVAWGHIDQLSLVAGEVLTRGQRLKPGHAFQSNPNADRAFACRDFDLVWVLSLGKRNSFLDKIQLLKILEAHTRVINSTEALLYLRSKYGLTQLGDLFQHPKTFASNQAQTFTEIIERGGDWILKPAAGSLGRGIFLLNKATHDYPNLIRYLLGQNGDHYLILQEHIPAIERGEKRILMAAGHLIGAYLRRQDTDHRTNLMQGGKAEQTTLTQAEQALAITLGAYCSKLGAEFIGIDLVYPYVIEINVINPGGLGTLKLLGEENQAGEVIKRILQT